jgi:diguanylate cyclase (GGDEF)-like protein
VNNCSAKQDESPSWSRCLAASESEMGVPLLALGETLGVIVISHPEANAFSGEDRSIAQAAGDVCATAIRNVQLSDELLRVANTDAVTGVFNQRYFHLTVTHEIVRAKRFGKLFSIVMFDLKRFGEINRTSGFDSGDEVLRGVAQVLRSTIRAIDTICRYSADRFAIILPETSAEQLKTFQGKISHELAAVPFSRTGSKISLEAVFASVQYPLDGATELELVRQLLLRLEKQKTTRKGASAS